MNILFIHGNFPGQFKDIAPALADRCGGRVLFLTLSQNPQDILLPNVEVRQFCLHRDLCSDTHAYVQPAELAVLKGQAVLRTLNQLHQEEGFVPDVVVCHGGMGFGLFVKALIPKVRLISYMEWYFTLENSKALFADLSINDQLKLESRNLPLLQEMVVADEIVCPTEWQKSQFPAAFQDQIKVIFDGVDLDFFCPGPAPDPLVIGQGKDLPPLSFSADQLLLTYGTRGMEPLRGFPEFMQAAAVAQQEFPDLQVIVFGNDRSAYSYQSPHETGSWKSYMLEELKDQLDLSRLHFTGLLSYMELVQLFRRSNLHCYFSRPYVVSWGVFQAAACGARLLVNDFFGLTEVFEGNMVPSVVSISDQSAINAVVLNQLASKNLEANQTSSLSNGLDLASSICKWQDLLGL